MEETDIANLTPLQALIKLAEMKERLSVREAYSGREMRIALFTDNFREDMGGGTRIVVDLARGLKERGHDVLVVTGQFVDGAGRGLDLPKLPSLRIPLYDKAEMVFPCPDLIKRLREFDPDVIHFHEPFTAGLIALIAGKALKKGIVGSVYIDPRHLSRYSLRIDRGGIAKASLASWAGRRQGPYSYPSTSKTPTGGFWERGHP
ncbi:MAG: glycosyltransferase [Aquificota bacterium]|nr:glycosyltransferase [Aquificota bacterium]